ncbi:MAG: hypothetical protein HC840_00805 [Leptolyngbyaceae cyanobacterium RM2_2_4]|nr:hypothetical protein [Leptolyngbyaceae cyanobacterium RM2_2_4]
MAITTVEEQKKRLRQYLNPYLKGPTVDAVLEALAVGNAAYLIDNVRAVNDQLYIATAAGRYLDEVLAAHGITRPPSVGLSDDVFRQIGIEVKNRKQVRDLIHQLLNAIFGDEYVRASNDARAFEPYNLQDGDTLIINFDDHITVPIEFNTGEFQNIAAAKAQEVADVITKELRRLGYAGTAIAKDDGNGPYVEILSDTIGPTSSVTILGGRAQNELRFDSPVAAGGNMSTQWTLSLQPGGIIRFTWSGGANPQLGKLSSGNYVNVFGGGFSASPNEGSYTIVDAKGGPVNTSYFEVVNPLGTSGIVVQGIDDAVTFYDPVRKTLSSRLSYAAVYQPTARLLQIFLPAATKVIRRGREGSAHLHDQPRVSYSLQAQPNLNDTFQLTNTQLIQQTTNFVNGATIAETVQNMAAAINTLYPTLKAYANSEVLNVFVNDAAATMVGTYSGIAAITASGPLGDMASLAPDQEGPYMYDTSQPFTVSNIGTTLSQNLDGTMPRVINVADASQFPDEQGNIILGYGTQTQEGPIPYIARPSNTTLLISPAYNVKKSHVNGTDVALVSQKSSPEISRDGLDYPFYITDVVSGRIYVQDLINSVAASGINIVFTILYPSDIGLGKWGTQYTENPQIWGE